MKIGGEEGTKYGHELNTSQAVHFITIIGSPNSTLPVSIDTPTFAPSPFSLQ